jgi:hypothetical protein
MRICLTRISKGCARLACLAYLVDSLSFLTNRIVLGISWVVNMSTLLLENPTPTRAEVEQRFDGNICR